MFYSAIKPELGRANVGSFLPIFPSKLDKHPQSVQNICSTILFSPVVSACCTEGQPAQLKSAVR